MPALITWWTQDLAELSPRADPVAVAAAGADLLRRWAEPQRRYHSTRHLVELFWALEELEDAHEIDADAATVGRVAAWLHDAVYDPRARHGANEAASAALARSLLTRLHVHHHASAAVESVIRMTDGHDGDDGEALTRCFHDADLWILSAPGVRFDDYCDEVREEYAHVPDAAYRSARAGILADFVRRDRLYLTTRGQQEWDEPARANLHRELDRLG